MTEKEIGDVIDWLTEVATPGSEWNQFYSDSEVEKVARDALEIVKQNTNIRQMVILWKVELLLEKTDGNVRNTKEVMSVVGSDKPESEA